MKPLLTHPLYLSLFLYQLLTLLASSYTVYTPIDDITLACGSFSDQATSLNWTGDINSKFSPIQVGNTNTSSQVRTSPTPRQVPFTAARLSHSEFTYRFPLSPGQKFIRLYFNLLASYQDFDRSKSHFSVKAGGFTLLKDFNAYAAAVSDSMESTLIREFCVNIDSQQQSLNITFSPTREIPDAYAFINGIEIVSMPSNLYYTATESEGIPYLGNQVNYYIENSTALESMYRINVGGQLVSAEGDTGMYRTWNEDDPYLDGVSDRLSITPLTSNPELNFTKIHEYAAPKEVYRTGRTMDGTKKNLRFELQSHLGFSCRSRFFLLANQTAEKHADIILWSGGNAVPVYKDYIVYMPGQGSKKKVNLFLALQADPNDWESKYINAILNGLEIFKINDTNGNLARPNPDLPEVTPPKPSCFRHTCSLCSRIFGFQEGKKSQGLQVQSSNKVGSVSFTMTKSTKSRGSSLPSRLCQYFSLAEIKAATENFNETFIIGVGGFGNVYKGCIDGGANPIAVAIKRLKATSSQGAREFVTEIETLCRLRHRHLVSLIGYCADEDEMILVYDYMARGTLRDHLYQTENPHLPWEQRLHICIGAAQGLHYLHTGTEGTIIHRDVKSANILLDEKWIAKVSDFGLSKMSNITMSKTHISTMVKGSFGYIDPEYYRRQQLTEKSDVYSFGVVLCEVLCGRPAITTVENDRVSLAKWAKKCHGNGKLHQIIDPKLKGKIATRCLLKYISIVMSCMDDNGMNRPSMKDVVGGLEYALQLQLQNEEYDHCMEMIFQDETPGIRGNERSFCSEQSSGANESVQQLTGTIFSEIINPIGR
ncbi:hypothetical protein M0R45_033233 [Rubus argutus]|uniref:Protein kinase domain-containing protein n=1 Tax=Rubus argutus TaxID=59490 RepID=A0AAW1WL54_RUBAR